MSSHSHKVQTMLGGMPLSFETGKVARQADGSAWVQFGGTVVLVASVTAREASPDRGFLPLSVDYRERAYAAGKIPGGFFKREGRPTEKETLSARLTDRPMRPLFPKGMLNETQIHVQVLSSDQENDADVLAINGASLSLCLSGIPFGGPVGAVRVGLVDGEFVVNPTFEQRERSELDLVVAGTEEAILMLEGSGKEVPETKVLAAVEFGYQNCLDVIRLQKELLDEARKEDRELLYSYPPEEFVAKVRTAFGAEIDRVNRETGEKHVRQRSLDELRARAKERFQGEGAELLVYLGRALDDIERDSLRAMILQDKLRSDGRAPDVVRDIWCEVGVLPRTHGSAIFTRGQTQVLGVTTLGTAMDEQKMDLLEGLAWKNYYLHYNFPPFSVGEVRPARGPGRREIGHGMLAERAIKAVLPRPDVFPYTIRVVSDVLESNGSSSMGTVCAGSLALMDAGVPLSSPVAGVAMGLIHEGDRLEILTDISGVEDHLGDMDFKLAGTRTGMTAIQMDNKISGVSMQVLERAFQRAKQARMHIMEEMSKTLADSRDTLSPYAPRIVLYRVAQEKIGEIIGPGGRVIRRITEESGADISVEDDGEVRIAGVNDESCRRALELIKNIVEDPEIGRVYEGKVVKIMNFGAFVEILPGRDGLLHISEIDEKRIDRVEDVLQEGDEVLVKVIGIDDQGKIKLSRRAVMAAARS